MRDVLTGAAHDAHRYEQIIPHKLRRHPLNFRDIYFPFLKARERMKVKDTQTKRERACETATEREPERARQRQSESAREKRIQTVSESQRGREKERVNIYAPA